MFIVVLLVTSLSALCILEKWQERGIVYQPEPIRKRSAYRYSRMGNIEK